MDKSSAGLVTAVLKTVDSCEGVCGFEPHSTRQYVVELYNLGYQPWDISRRTKISKEQVKLILTESGVLLRKRGLRPGHTAWNKGLTAKDHPSISEGAKKIGASLSGRDGWRWSEQQKLEHSERCKGVVGGYRPGSGRCLKSSIEHLGVTYVCDSSYEHRFISRCIDLGIEFQKSRCNITSVPDNFQYEGGRYYPDFWVPSIRSYIEIKGFMTDRDHLKISAVRAAGFSINVLMLEGLVKFESGLSLFESLRSGGSRY